MEERSAVIFHPTRGWSCSFAADAYDRFRVLWHRCWDALRVGLAPPKPDWGHAFPAQAKIIVVWTSWERLWHEAAVSVFRSFGNGSKVKLQIRRLLTRHAEIGLGEQRAKLSVRSTCGRKYDKVVIRPYTLLLRDVYPTYTGIVNPRCGSCGWEEADTVV